MENSKLKVKIGIYGIGFLMMGGLWIFSSLVTISNNFPGVSQVMIQNLISIPSIMIIPTTLIIGKIIGVVSKKWIAAAGIVLFIAGGIAPAFLTSFVAILAVRGIFGVGLGICQVAGNALVAENFSGAEKDRTQGTLLAIMMCGAAVMVFLSGIMSEIRWELAFYIHLAAALPLLFAFLFLPVQKLGELGEKPDTRRQGVKINSSCWVWVGTMFIIYISAQVFPVFLSFLLEGKQLGGTSGSALAMLFFAVGGVLTGVLYGWLSGIFKRYTITIGCLSLAIANAIIAFSTDMAMCCAGSFLMGSANIMLASCVFIRAGMSVDTPSVGMAISLVSCAQNLGQFCSPFVINLLVANINQGDINFTAFLCAGVIAVVLAVLTLKKGSEGA